LIKEAINRILEGKALLFDEAVCVMNEIMDGTATPAQFGAFVVALRMKGESVHEIGGLASVMRNKTISVQSSGMVIDTCGTGGDRSGTFNISTAAAIVAAAAGLKVAKHGNRAMSSCCGSADVLEALGVNINLSADQAAECLDKVGLCFMFAPLYHPAMKKVGGLRRELGIRTVFNLLGPLTNPARACAQVVGVSQSELVVVIAEVLKELGISRGLVVHGADGLDELTILNQNEVAELKDNKVKFYSINPEEYGLAHPVASDISGGTARENAYIIKNIFKGEKGPRRDIVVLNSAAALMVGGKSKNLTSGIELARNIIDSGLAFRKLEEFVNISQSYLKTKP
jgi:anthranilate phosphoribosyltransferase